MSAHLELVTEETALVCEVCGKAGDLQLYRGFPFHETHAPKQWRVEREEHERFLHEVRLRLLFDRSPEYWEE